MRFREAMRYKVTFRKRFSADGEPADDPKSLVSVMDGVIDDAEMGVTEVVRGDDLIDSTPRQILLYRALGMPERVPKYWHLPLVVGTDGRRLAKRHGDTRLAYYRERGVAAERVVGLLARWSGIEAGEEISAAGGVARFDVGRLPKEQIVFTADDDRWLLQGARGRDARATSE